MTSWEWILVLCLSCQFGLKTSSLFRGNRGFSTDRTWEGKWRKRQCGQEDGNVIKYYFGFRKRFPSFPANYPEVIFGRPPVCGKMAEMTMWARRWWGWAGRQTGTVYYRKQDWGAHAPLITCLWKVNVYLHRPDFSTLQSIAIAEKWVGKWSEDNSER